MILEVLVSFCPKLRGQSAIRESSILKCNASGHRFHGVPDIENKQKLKSVANDCVMVMKKHIEVLNKEYPIPKSLKEGFYE